MSNAIVPFKIKPDLINFPDFISPARGSTHAAGIDLFAQKDMRITNKTELFDLGFSASVPEGYVAVIVPRSGLGAKYNMQLANTLAVIDSDYRGEWKAALHIGQFGTAEASTEHYPHDQEPTFYIDIERGKAFAQVLILPVPNAVVEIVDYLPDTERGSGGFGSSDK